MRPIAPDLRYALDCAMEDNGIHAGQYVALMELADRSQLDELIEGNLGTRHGSGRANLHAALSGYANRLFVQLGPEKQAGLVALGLNTLSWKVQDTAEFFAVSAITDLCEGGALKDFKHYTNGKSYDSTPPKRASRKLLSRHWINRYVDRAQETWQLHSSYEGIAQFSCTIDWRSVKSVYDWEEERSAAMEIRTAQMAQEWARLREGVRKETSKLRKPRRKVLRRSWQFAVELFGDREPVDRFLTKKYLDLATSDPDVKLRAICLDPYGVGHGAVGLQLIGAEGQKLADLCSYTEKSPALDQLAALKLALDCGEEEEIFAGSNVTTVSEEGLRCPLLKRTKFSNRVENAHARAGCSEFDVRQNRNSDYWERTRPLWVERLCVKVFGQSGAANVLKILLGTSEPGSPERAGAAQARRLMCMD